MISWIKFFLGIRKWVSKPLYYQEKGKIFCITHGDFGWKQRGDLDIHDMRHWD